MSRIKDAFERRSLTSYESGPFPITAPDTPGEYGWQAGMVWRGLPGGGPVTADESMRLSAVFACLRLLSEAVATLPLDTFTRSGGIRKPYRPRPEYLSFNPPQQSRIDYLSQVMLSLLTDGNAYILTPRDELGIPIDLVVVDPTLMAVSREGGRLKYRLQNQLLDPNFDLMHIKGMCLPGEIKGLSPIAYARETIGVGLEAQRYGKAFFENGAVPSVVVSAPGKYTQEAAARFVDGWNANHRGSDNAAKVGFLTEGAALNKVSINPDEAQFLQTRQFQVPDIARIFGVPPHLIADASNSTSWGTGLAEQNLAFGQFSLRPWLERIEEAHGRLLTSQGLEMVFIKLNMDAVLRASAKDRYETAAIGIVNHFLTINEQRALEDLPPVPWGDEPFVLTKVTESGAAPTNIPGLEDPASVGAPAGGGKPVVSAPAVNGTAKVTVGAKP